MERTREQEEADWARIQKELDAYHAASRARIQEAINQGKGREMAVEIAALMGIDLNSAERPVVDYKSLPME